jgi:hypothetical protein
MKVLTAMICILHIAVLSACGGTTGYIGPSVSVANKVKVGLHLNTEGNFILTGEAEIPLTPDEFSPIGEVDLDVGFETVLNEAKQAKNHLYLIWEDDNGELYRESFDLGQPFQIDFERESWVRKIANTGDGDILVEVEKHSVPVYEQNLTSNIEPPSASDAITCPGAPSIRVDVGDLVRVTTTDGSPLFLRSSPRIDNNAIDSLTRGMQLRIVDGPVCSDNFSYWKVKIPGTSSIGWVAEGNFSLYFIEPIY